MANVLLVEDDDAVARVIARGVRHCGHKVRIATNGWKALEGLEGIELLITDIDMPEMDGLELIVALLERDGAVPVIAMSGGGDSEVMLGRAAALGAASTLEKPFGVEILCQAIDAALDDAGMRGPA